MNLKITQRRILAFVLLLIYFTTSSRAWTASAEQSTLLMSNIGFDDWPTPSVSVYGIVVDDVGNQYQLSQLNSATAVVKLDSAGQMVWAKEFANTETGYDHIQISSDYNNIFFMIYSSTGMYIMKMSKDSALGLYGYFVSKTINNLNTDLRLSPSGDYLGFSVIDSGTNYETFLMSVGDFSTSTYGTVGSITANVLREIVPISGTKMFYIYFSIADSKIKFVLHDHGTSTITYRVPMDCPTTSCNGHTITANHAETDSIVVAIASEGFNMIQFMNSTDGSIIGNQWKLTTPDASINNNVYCIVYKDQKVYLTTGNLELSMNSALVIFDRSTEESKIYSMGSSGLYNTMNIHPTAEEIFVGKVGDSNAQANIRRLTLENILLIGEYTEADPSLVFTEVTDGSYDLGVAETSLTATASSYTPSILSLPSHLIANVTVNRADVYTLNLQTTGDEITRYTDITGELYDMVNVSCIDSYGSPITYTIEAYGDGLDGTTLVTAIDSATGQLTLDTMSVEARYTLAIRATYTGGLLGYTINPLIINTEDEPVVEQDEESEGEAWFGLSNSDWGLAVTGIILGLLLIIGVVSTLLFWRFIFKCKKTETPKNNESRV